MCRLLSEEELIAMRENVKEKLLNKFSEPSKEEGDERGDGSIDDTADNNNNGKGKVCMLVGITCHSRDSVYWV